MSIGVVDTSTGQSPSFTTTYGPLDDPGELPYERGGALDTPIDVAPGDDAVPPHDFAVDAEPGELAPAVVVVRTEAAIATGVAAGTSGAPAGAGVDGGGVRTATAPCGDGLLSGDACSAAHPARPRRNNENRRVARGASNDWLMQAYRTRRAKCDSTPAASRPAQSPSPRARAPHPSGDRDRRGYRWAGEPRTVG